jgi:anti-sigma regulatory factor (Ser/Thr protein kinase)
MLEIALHLLDIVENSTRAGARNIGIKITEDGESDTLAMEVRDDGAGMDRKTIKKVLDPFYTTKSVRRVGLGLPLLLEAAERTGGSLKIESQEGNGTTVRAVFGHSHIDRQPLGNIAGTLIALLAGNPDVDFSYRHTKNGKAFYLDSSEIKRELEDVPITHSEVLSFLRRQIEEGLEEIGVKPQSSRESSSRN